MSSRPKSFLAALLLTLLLPPWAGAITFDEVKNGSGSGTSLALPAQTLAAGSLVVACAKWENAVNLSSITDTASNTYALLTQSVHSGTEPRIRCGYVLSAAANASNVVTLNFSASAAFVQGFVYEFTYAGTAAFDVEVGSTIADTDLTPSSNTLTTTGTEEVCVAIQGDYTSQTFSSHTINGQTADGHTDSVDASIWYEIFSATFSGGASSLTRTSTAAWMQNLSCFKVSGGGPATSGRLLLLGVGP